MDYVIRTEEEREFYLKEIKHGKLPFKSRVEGIYYQRSVQSNKYYFGVIVKYLSEETGYFPEEMHNELLKKFAKIYEVIDENGRDLIICESTSGMNEMRFNKYCNDIKVWALGYFKVQIPEPHEILETEEVKEKLIY